MDRNICPSCRDHIRLLVCFNAGHASFFSGIRGYSLLLFATALSFYFASQISIKPDKRFHYIGLTSAPTAAVATHLVGVILLPNIFLLLSMPSRQKHHLLSIILWLVIPSVVFVLEYYFFMSAEVRGRTAEIWWMPQVTIDLIGVARSLWVYDSPDKINDLLRRMEEAKCSSRFWMLHHDKVGVALHSSLRSYIDWFSATITIVYHNPTMTFKNKSYGLHRENLNTNHEVFASVCGGGQFAFWMLA